MALRAWDYVVGDPTLGAYCAGYNGLADTGSGDIETPEILIPAGWYHVEIRGTRVGAASNCQLRIQGHPEQDTPANWGDVCRIQGPTGTSSVALAYVFAATGLTTIVATSLQYTDMALGVFFGPVPGIRLSLENLTGTPGDGIQDLNLAIRRLFTL